MNEIVPLSGEMRGTGLRTVGDDTRATGAIRALGRGPRRRRRGRVHPRARRGSLLIVGLSAPLGPEAIDLALEQGDGHERAPAPTWLDEAHPLVASFGARFALLRFLHSPAHSRRSAGPASQRAVPVPVVR